MRTLLTLTITFYSIQLLSQSFTTYSYPIVNTIGTPVIATADLNHDGKPELMLSGEYAGDGPLVTDFYELNEQGFYIKNTSVDIDAFSDIAFADVDGDNDLDFILVSSNGFEAYTSLYINEGDLNFLKSSDQNFVDLITGKVKFADVDSDGDEDVLITGLNENYVGTSNLYINDGQGNYQLAANTGLPTMREGTIDFADFDNDGDLDLFMTGSVVFDYFQEVFANLFINNGDGNFELLPVDYFIPMDRTSADVVDYDGDLDMDIIVEGRSEMYLYTNNGAEGFSGTEFPITDASNVIFNDFDLDGDFDIMYSDQLSAEENKLQILEQDQGIFELNNQNNFIQNVSTFAIADVNDDSKSDILYPEDIFRVYLNEGGGLYKEKAGSAFELLTKGSPGIGDLNGNGNDEIVHLGWGRYNFENTLVYEKTDDGFSYQESDDYNFMPLSNGVVDIADVDSDGNNDVLLTGENAQDENTFLYLQDDSGNFSKMEGQDFEFIGNKNAKFIDVNMDGISEIAVMTNSTLEIYSLDADGNYKDMEIDFGYFISGQWTQGDLDGDLDTDIIISGVISNTPDVTRETHIFINDGVDNFIKVDSSSVIGATLPDIALFDTDNDNDLDLIISGRVSGWDPLCHYYINDGFGQFTLKSDSLQAYYSPTIAHADLDLDGDQDYVIMGTPSQSTQSASIYINDGNGNFELHAENPLIGLVNADLTFYDFDENGYPDLLVTGYYFYDPVTMVYLNNSLLSKDPEQVNPENDNYSFKLSPNPTSQKEILLSHNSKISKQVRITLFDVYGRFIKHQSHTCVEGLNEITIQIPTLKAACYLVRLEDGERTKVQKLVVSN